MTQDAMREDVDDLIAAFTRWRGARDGSHHISVTMKQHYALLQLLRTHQSREAEVQRLRELLKTALTHQEYMLEWIDAIPHDTEMPTMPGFDRDAVEDELHRTRCLLERQALTPAKEK